MFDDIRQKIRLQYRVFFTGREEMDSWLGARGYKKVDPDNYSADTRHSHEEWLWSSQDGRRFLLKIASEVFDESGKLRVFTPDEWKDEWVISMELIKDETSDASLPL